MTARARVKRAGVERPAADAPRQAPEGVTTGDPVGLALVGTLTTRAAGLPESARVRLLARAEVLRASYAGRPAGVWPSRDARVQVVERGACPPATRDGGPASASDGWSAVLEARRRERAPRVRTEVASATWMAELRASAATARAADQVAEAAGPYNGAAVASRTLDELVALAPGYVGSYVAWLEDLASLADLPERRSSRRKF